MPIYEESRYETAPVVPVEDSDGVYRATIQAPLGSTETDDDYTVHRVVDGDRMDLLAERAFGDPEFWWRIADANPDLEYPDKLMPGQLIRIPVLVSEF